jgi:four helix bundle protein
MACIVLAIETMAPDTRLPHEKLLAYQFALDLLKQVRALDFADAKLADQILRASKSVCLNIAEAVGRFGDADRRRVYAIARGECCEAAAAIDIALVTAECDVDRGRLARDTAARVYALLTGLIRRYDLEIAGSKRNRVETENPHGHPHDTENPHGHPHDTENPHEHPHDAENPHEHPHETENTH